MKKVLTIAGILLAGLAPLACQKTYSLAPLTAGSNPTATSTPNPELNRWNVVPEPFDVTVDAAGNFYPLNSINNSNIIVKYSSAGILVTQWGTLGSGNGQFSTPGGIAYNSPGGTLYVADSGNNRVQVFNTAGSYLSQFPTAVPGYAIVTDLLANVYLTTATGVEVYTSTGTFITSWGSTGVGNGQFNGTPEGIGVDQFGNVFVTDFLNYRVQKFNNSGTYLAQWGTNGTGNGQFSHPWGIAVGPTGYVYVVDQTNDNVQKFDNNGNYLSKWGGSVAYLNGPSGAWMDGSGHVYIANSADQQIVEIQF